MSAFLVSKVHIDALVDAARYPRYALRWYDCEPDHLWQQAASAEAYWQAMDQHRHHADQESPDRTGAMLWGENLASLIARYPNDRSGHRPGPADLTDEQIAGYTFRHPQVQLSAVALLKALACYEYQSSEHPGWRTSEAWYFCQALRKALIDRLPGYDEAAWDLN